MPLAEIIETLLRRRLAVAAVLLASLVAGVLGGYRLDGFPPTGLQTRTLPLGVASKQILVDAPENMLADIEQNDAPMTARVGAFSQLLASDAIVRGISRLTGIPRDEITTEGPFDGAAAGQNVVTPSESRALQVLHEQTPYRLAFIGQVDLPLLTIHVQGPGPAEAARVAEAAYTSLERYLATLDAQVTVKPVHPVVLRDLGPANAGALHKGIGKAVVVLAFTGVLIIGLLLVLSIEVLDRRRHAVNTVVDFGERGAPNGRAGIAPGA